MSFFPRPSDIEGIIQIFDYLSTESLFENDLNEFIEYKKIPFTAIDAAIELGIIELKSDLVIISKSQKILSPGKLIENRRNLIYHFAKENMIFFAALENCGPRTEHRPASVGRNISQLLLWAKLKTPLEENARLWWKRLRSDLIKINNQEKPSLEETGWIGENLTLEYEKNRLQTDIGIEHVSNLDGPNAGYDVLSWEDSSMKKRKRIEVKSSTLGIAYAKVHISWNEWTTAKTIGEYEFHCWPNINNPPVEPITVSFDEMQRFIPDLPNKYTRWDSFTIPMRLLVCDV